MRHLMRFFVLFFFALLLTVPCHGQDDDAAPVDDQTLLDAVPAEAPKPTIGPKQKPFATPPPKGMKGFLDQKGQTQKGAQQKLGTVTGKMGKEQIQVPAEKALPARLKDTTASRLEKIYARYYRDISTTPMETFDFRLWDEGTSQKMQAEADKDRQPLKQFGYDFFAGDFKTEALAVPDGAYVIGPGDQLFIRAWGAGIDFEQKVLVAPEGTISLPSLGVITVAGRKNADLEAVINAEAQKYVPGVNLHVSLASLKSLEIYISGNVAQPGLRLVPAFSTIVTALSKYGPPTKDGSLRHIKLFRHNKEIAELDLYEILLHGNRSQDAHIESGDLIFVPNIGKTVALAGLVHKEAIFELKNESSWQEVASLAGGLLPQAENSALLLKRFVNNTIQIVDKIALKDQARQHKAFTIEDGDYLVVPAPLLERAIKLSGHVFQPGIIEYKPGMTLQDVLRAPGKQPTDRPEEVSRTPGAEKEKVLLKPGAIMENALLRRYDPTSGYFGIERFPLNEVLAGRYNAVLREYDEIIILSKENYDIKETVLVDGAVQMPGEYPFAPGLRLSSLVAMAGGLKESAVLTEVELNRPQVVDSKTVLNRHIVDYQEIMRGGPDVVLDKNDHVIFKAIKNFGKQEFVMISGEVAFPGKYSLAKDDRIADLISRAGGYLDHAYLYGARFERESSRQIKRQSYTKLIEKLELDINRVNTETAKGAINKDEKTTQAIVESQQKFLEQLKKVEVDGRIVIQLASLPSLSSSEYNFLLEPGDSLDIPKRPDFISVLGSVYNNNSYFYDQNLTVQDYLLKSGGATPEADTKRVYIGRANGDVVGRHTQGRFFINSFDNLTLMPGDTVVVPEDFDRVPWLKMVLDISDVIFKLATTAGVAVAIAN